MLSRDSFGSWGSVAARFTRGTRCGVRCRAARRGGRCRRTWGRCRSRTGRRTRVAARSPHGGKDGLFAAIRNFVFVLFETGEDSSSTGWYPGTKLLHVGCACSAGVRGLWRRGLRGQRLWPKQKLGENYDDAHHQQLSGSRHQGLLSDCFGEVKGEFFIATEWVSIENAGEKESPSASAIKSREVRC